MNVVNEKNVSSETKKELNEIIDLYSELRENYKQLDQLIRKYKNRTINRNEVAYLTTLIEKFKKVKVNQKELFINLRAFRNFYLANEIWYNERILTEKEKFAKFLAQKLLLQNEMNNNDKKLVTSSITDLSNQIGNKCSNINLKKYAQTVIENYRKSILEEYKKLGIKLKQVHLNGDFSIKRTDFEDSEQFDKIVNSRDKYLWYGLVYKITELLPDKSEGRSIGGFTTRSLSNRWKYYVFKAIFRQGQGGKLHKLIYNYLYDFGFENLKTNGNYNWRLIFGLLNSRFRRTPMEIHFSSNSLRSGEINFIENNDLIDSGLNIRKGGEGGDKIVLPMIQIAYYIALGYMEREIYQILINRGYTCSVTTVRRRIRDFWGSFEEAQVKFLRPIFYLLMRDNFQLYEINNAFDKFTLNYIETMFGNIPYKELIEIIKSKRQKNILDFQDLFDLPIIKKLDGWEGKTKLRIPANILINLIIKYSTMNKAIKNKEIQTYLNEYRESYYRFALISQIYNQLGCPTWNDARKVFATPHILNDFRTNQSFEIIYQRYGWSKLYAHNHNRISSKLFFGMRSLQVRQYLIKNPSIKSYVQFEEVFLSKKGKFLKPLPPRILNNLIIKHIDIDKAQLELNSMGYSMYHFLKEIEKVYSSWDNAIKLVKIPYIINLFRYGLNPIEIYQKVGYSKISAINHNAISKRLFFGANTEIILLFLEMNPDISTLKDFEIKYNQGFLGKIN